MSSAALRVSHQPEREGGANGSAGAAWTGGGTWRGRSGWTGTPPHGSAGWSAGPRGCCGKTVIVDLVATRDDPGGFLNERSNPWRPRSCAWRSPARGPRSPSSPNTRGCQGAASPAASWRPGRQAPPDATSRGGERDSTYVVLAEQAPRPSCFRSSGSVHGCFRAKLWRHHGRQ